MKSCESTGEGDLLQQFFLADPTPVWRNGENPVEAQLAACHVPFDVRENMSGRSTVLYHSGRQLKIKRRTFQTVWQLPKSGKQTFVCSSVEQKTFIDVSRNGTKAAAVTWAGMECTSAAPMESYSVILDRPFVYAIVDNATGLPLFVGVIGSMN